MIKNKLLMKILVIMILLIIIISTNSIKIFASSEFKDPTEDPDYWNPIKDQNGQEITQDEPELLNKAGILLGVISVLGVVSAVIALVLLGMKYFIGSVEEKADIKKSLWIYILGIVLLVACTTVPNIIFNLSQGVFK